MILKWIQSAGVAGQAKAAEQGDEAERKVRRESKLIDVAHEALVERAARDRATLDVLSRLGMTHVRRDVLKGRVRKKVWDVVREDSQLANADLVEEVTERIVDAAEADPYYKRVFGIENG